VSGGGFSKALLGWKGGKVKTVLAPTREGGGGESSGNRETYYRTKVNGTVKTKREEGQKSWTERIKV